MSSKDLTDVSSNTVADLRKIAKELGITNITRKNKGQLVEEIIDMQGKVTNKEQETHPQAQSPSPSEYSVPAIPKKPVQQNQHESNGKQNKQKRQNLEKRVGSNQENNQNQNSKNTQSNSGRINGNKNNFDQKKNKKNKNQHNNGDKQNGNLNQHAHSHRSNAQNEKTTNQTNDTNGNGDLSFREGSTVEISGVLDLAQDNSHGVLRSQKLLPSDKDTYISLSQVKKFRLRKGDFIHGIARLPKDNERYYSLLWITFVNGKKAEDNLLQNRKRFEDYKPIYPEKQIVLETDQYTVSTRIIDLLSPIGYGQRSMVVAPPKSGKTFILKDIAQGINKNHPEIQLMVVLIGERPEEVTDIERSVNGLVYASNFDEDPQSQVTVAELSLERAKRLVELGKDVVILMDSLTRLSRAYNVALPASGRTLSGGLDPASLYPSKKLFGAARNFEGGASLTIVATALVDTGSKMDDVIFEEFKGTGNNELYLDRSLANKRVFPALDWNKSGTRNEELLLGQEKLHASWKIRKMLQHLGDDGTPSLIDRMKTTKTNEEFLNSLNS